MRVRYIFIPGSYGKRHRSALVPDIAHLFYGEEVEHDTETNMLHFRRAGLESIPATNLALSVLRGDEFKCERTCEHRDGNGNICQKKPLGDGAYCMFHQTVVNSESPQSFRDMARDAADKALLNRGPVIDENETVLDPCYDDGYDYDTVLDGVRDRRFGATLWAFDRDATVVSGEPPGPIPLTWVERLVTYGELTGDLVWAFGNQKLKDEAGGIPGNQELVSLARNEKLILTDKYPDAHSVDKRDKLRMLKKLYPDMSRYVVTDDVDFSDMNAEGWEYFHPRDFVREFGADLGVIAPETA